MSKIKSMLVFCFLIAAFRVNATEYIVNTNVDENDGSCADGDCSLRDAITLSNLTLTVDDSISFDPSVTLLCVSQATLQIIDSVTIVGNGKGVTVIDGGNTSAGGSTSCPKSFVGSLITKGGDVSSFATIKNLTFQNAKTESSGGAIMMTSGSLVLESVEFLHNYAYQAGALYVYSDNNLESNSNIEMNDVTVSGNTANIGGGIIISRANGTIKNSLISENSTYYTSSTSPGQCGGIIISDSYVSIDETVISDNKSTFFGGGLYVSNTAEVKVTNSTLSGNYAVTAGGVMVVSSSLTLDSVTISGNQAASGSAAYVSSGIMSIESSTIADNQGVSTSGIALSDSQLTIHNSIVANNGEDGKKDCALTDEASIVSKGYNIISIDTCTYSPDPNDIPTTDGLILSALADNGGPTKTHALDSSSGIINQGDCLKMDSTSNNKDQRGLKRDSKCDPGAYEYVVYYQDLDGDGYGTAVSTIPAGSLTLPIAYSDNDTDCDDTHVGVNPNASEICGDGLDNDCNPSSRDAGTNTYYSDNDNDGYGTSDKSISSVCSAPEGYVSNKQDCDDVSSVTYPNAAEICDGADNDCNGSVDDGLLAIQYYDEDADGFGTAVKTILACGVTKNYSFYSTDCDDSNSEINPSKSEIYSDGIDNDCSADSEDDSKVYYIDNDGDGHGDINQPIIGVDLGAGYSLISDDCDDTQTDAYPGNAEVCDGVDNDCDGNIDIENCPETLSTNNETVNGSQVDPGDLSIPGEDGDGLPSVEGGSDAGVTDDSGITVNNEDSPVSSGGCSVSQGGHTFSILFIFLPLILFLRKRSGCP